MSEVDEVKKLIQEQNNIFETEFKKEVTRLDESGVKNSEALEKMNTRFDDISAGRWGRSPLVSLHKVIADFLEEMLRHCVQPEYPGVHIRFGVRDRN